MDTESVLLQPAWYAMTSWKMATASSVFKDKSARGTPRDTRQMGTNLTRLVYPGPSIIVSIPGLLNTILTTATRSPYKKNVRVLSRCLSRAPAKLKAASYKNDCANGKPNNQIEASQTNI